MKATAKIRVSLDLTTRQFELLEKLVTLLDTASKVEVIRGSLQLYYQAIVNETEGGKLHLLKADGSTTSITVLPKF